MEWSQLLSWIALAGAVGTAAMGLVEAMKVVTLPGVGSLATIGLGKVGRLLGRDALTALDRVYGPEAGDRLLDGAWRKGPQELQQTLGNGLRMAVFADLQNLDGFIAAFGQNPKEISAAVMRLRAGDAAGGGALDPATARERVARLEAAIDARVSAAVAAGRDAYVTAMQFVASLVAVFGCVLVVALGAVPGEGTVGPTVWQAALVGLLAVPIAPVAKDIATFLNSVRSAFEKRGAKG